MSDALALIAHDLKNALGGLEGELSRLIDDPSPVMAQRAHLHCSELRRQFIQFLTLYGARTEGLTPHCEDESPQALLEGLQRVWDAKLKVDEHPLSIRIATPQRAPAFWFFDHRLVRLALDAAIHNAVRFAHSQVTLDVHEEDGWLIWRVMDDGDGLGSEDPAADSATGLGTALSEAVATAHRGQGRVGHIGLKSTAGQGTEFTMALP